MSYELFCLESHILSFPKVLQIPPESPCIFYVYVGKSNKMHLHLMNFFPNNFPLHVPRKQFHHQEVISVHAAYSISRASIGRLAANTIRFLKLSEDVFDEKADRIILFQNYSFPLFSSLNCLLDKLAVYISWPLGL